MLSHPSRDIRDTQKNKEIHAKYKTKRPALRMLALAELGVIIQSGEHSSVSYSDILQIKRHSN